MGSLPAGGLCHAKAVTSEQRVGQVVNGLFHLVCREVFYKKGDIVIYVFYNLKRSDMQNALF